MSDDERQRHARGDATNPRPPVAPPPTAETPLAGADPDAVAAAVGRRLARAPDAAAWDDERFLAWAARESEEDARRARSTASWSDARLLAAGDALRATVHARALRVGRLERRPVRREPGVPGTPAEVRRAAAAVGATPVVDLAAAAGIGREIWDEVCDTWVKLPPEVPPGDYLAMQIAGESMAPLMYTGDTVLVRLDTRVERDTVIVARRPDDGYVCKRVRKVTRTTIELDSLAEGQPVITIPHDTRLVVGRVVLVWASPERARRRAGGT